MTILRKVNQVQNRFQTLKEEKKCYLENKKVEKEKKNYTKFIFSEAEKNCRHKKFQQGENEEKCLYILL